MRDNILQYLSSFDFLKDVFLIFLGALISYVWGKIKNGHSYIIGKMQVKKAIGRFDKEGIITLANAYPSYEAKNIKLTDSKMGFYLSFPANMENAFECKENDILFDGKTIEQLGNEMEIKDFGILVDKHRKKVADEFLQSKASGRSLFNNEKYGIYSIFVKKTNDKNEDDGFNIEFYKTDYFTHKVMRSIYTELKEKKDNPIQVKRVEDLIKYYPFLTSLGVNSMLILAPKMQQEMLVLVKRSRYMANMKKDQWHVSMNEGVSTTDLDSVSGDVSIHQSVIRGYLEELGIDNDKHQLVNEFRDIFLVLENLEVGITSLTKVHMSMDDFNICFKGAEDSPWETTGDYKFIPYVERDIKKFVKKSGRDITSACRYCLNMCLSRMV